jgi:hypothetical protein
VTASSTILPTCFRVLRSIYTTVVLTGDVNIHFEINCDPSAVNFDAILSSSSFSQHVTASTHEAGNLLDVIITSMVANSC